MAAGAKTLFAQDAIGLLIGVTVDALFEAVFACAYASMHGFIALVHDELHVALTHDIRVFNALLAFFNFYLGQGDAT